MFGSIVKELYEAFHANGDFQTNISVTVDSEASDKLGTIAVDLFYNKTYVPVGTVVLTTEIVENEATGKNLNLCYMEDFQLENHMLIQDSTTVLARIRSATSGIIKQPDDILFKFEKSLTALGGYLVGIGVTDIVYSEQFQTYMKRPDGVLFQVEVITPDHAHRTYFVDSKSVKDNSIHIENTFSGEFLNDIFQMGAQQENSQDDVAVKKAIASVVRGYQDASRTLDINIVSALIPFYLVNIEKWSNMLYVK
ncbi:MAG: hypothetical protein NC548_42915 [Lachnospiraceae bacterium]|nr:hypothetical protein [Lachnospiraceae bacterium]